MSLVGKTLRMGITTGKEKLVETITVLSEFVVDGERRYRCKVLAPHQGSHRVVKADVYDRMFTPATQQKTIDPAHYKGLNPNTKQRKELWQ